MDNSSVLPEISVSDFLQVDIRVGQICQVEDNLKARKAAYILTIDQRSRAGTFVLRRCTRDFRKLGKKISSAQITNNYSKQELKCWLYCCGSTENKFVMQLIAQLELRQYRLF